MFSAVQPLFSATHTPATGPPAKSAVKLNRKICKMRSVRDLSQFLKLNSPDLSAVNISTAATRLAKLSKETGHSPAGAVAEVLLPLAAANMQELQGRQLSNFVWSLAKLHRHAGETLTCEYLSMLDERAGTCLKTGLFTHPSEISILLWSFARFGHYPSQFVQQLRQCDGGFGASPFLAEFGGQEVSNFAWACAKLQICEPLFLEPLASRASDVVSCFTSKELSVTLWAFGKLGQQGPAVEELIETLSIQHSKVLSRCSGRDLANICWACARLQINPHGLVDSALDRACVLLHECHPQSISNLVWAMGKLDCTNAHRVNTFSDTIRSRAHCFSPQGLANILSTLAASKAADRDERPHCVYLMLCLCLFQAQTHSLINAIAEAALPFGPELSGQNMANMMWALGTLGHSSVTVDQLVDMIIGQVVLDPTKLTPQGLSTVLVASAKLHDPPRRELTNVDELLDTVLYRARKQAHTFNSQDGLSNLIWGYASVGSYPASLMDAVAVRAPHVMHEFSGQGLANLAWGYAKLNYVKPQRLYDAIAREAMKRMDSFTAMTIGSIVASFTDMYYPCLPLFDAVDEQVLARLAEFRGPLAERLISSYSTVGYCSKAALPLLGQAAESTIQSLAQETEGFKGSSRWSYRQRRHYTTLMVEGSFCALRSRLNRLIQVACWEFLSILVWVHEMTRNYPE
eukprot:scaffold31450_cov54-Prasinocladus_malaysianus.AAC.2